MADPSVERINALTQNARSTWFALLSVLLFVGITLMGVSDIDFYGVDRATQLPLINVSVPTPLFFYAAPILTAAVYSYFHLYLIRLWDELGSTPSRVQGVQLGNTISPWLVNDAALLVRRKRRNDNCVQRRALEWPSLVLNVVIIWGGGLGVLSAIWFHSLPARDFWMSQIALFSCVAALFAAIASATLGWSRMGQKYRNTSPNFWLTPLVAALFASVLLTGTYLTFEQTQHPKFWLNKLSLAGEKLVTQPASWRPIELARRSFMRERCASSEKSHCTSKQWIHMAEIDFYESRRVEVAAIDKPELTGNDPERTLQMTPKERANQMRRSTSFQDADLRSARLQGLNLTSINAHNARFDYADFEFASFTYANFSSAKFYNSKVAYSVFLRTNLTQAELYFLKARGTKFLSAELDGVVASNAHFHSASFVSSILTDTEFQTSLFLGTLTNPMVFDGSTLRGSIFHGSAFRNFSIKGVDDLASADFSNTFGVATSEQIQKMFPNGNSPCQWIISDGDLTEEKFFALWRGWIEAYPKKFSEKGISPDPWSRIAPLEWQTVEGLPPPKGCSWTKPLTVSYRKRI